MPSEETLDTVREGFYEDIAENIYRNCQDLEKDRAIENTKVRLRRLAKAIEEGRI